METKLILTTRLSWPAVAYRSRCSRACRGGRKLPLDYSGKQGPGQAHGDKLRRLLQEQLRNYGVKKSVWHVYMRRSCAHDTEWPNVLTIVFCPLKSGKPEFFCGEVSDVAQNGEWDRAGREGGWRSELSKPDEDGNEEAGGGDEDGWGHVGEGGVRRDREETERRVRVFYTRTMFEGAHTSGASETAKHSSPLTLLRGFYWLFRPRRDWLRACRQASQLSMSTQR